MTYYYLCVLDFEATCDDKTEIKDSMEIIEFPSVLYSVKIENENHIPTFISEFHEYVKPTIKPILTPFCTELTGITQEIVDKADIFKNVLSRHSKWLQNNVEHLNKVYFVTCGDWDLKTQLPRELKNKDLKCSSVYKQYINIKAEFGYFYKIKVSGMTGMLNHLKLTLDGKHHSGIDDTRNIAKILLELINEGHNKFNIRKL
jgi:inhibitor of KinA sporulation pathway (predicted exonuclease)